MPRVTASFIWLASSALLVDALIRLATLKPSNYHQLPIYAVGIHRLIQSALSALMNSIHADSAMLEKDRDMLPDIGAWSVWLADKEWMLREWIDSALYLRHFYPIMVSHGSLILFFLS